MLNMQNTAKWGEALDLLPTEKMDCPQSSASARCEAVGRVCNRDLSQFAFPSKSASPVACMGGIAITARLLVSWLQAARRRETACYRNGIRSRNSMDWGCERVLGEGANSAAISTGFWMLGENAGLLVNAGHTDGR